MNQILSVEINRNQKKEKKKLSIKSIVIFFCIMLIIFGGATISIGMYLHSKNGGNTIASGGNSANNNLKIEAIQSDSATLNITASGENVIDKIVYQWNNEEQTQVNGNSQKQMSLDINVPVGNNILKLTVTDSKGNSKTLEKTYVGTVQYKPEIKLSQEGNTISISCNSESVIDYISYNFDDGETKTQNVNNQTAEIPVEIKNVDGEHKLTIVVVNKDGEKYEETKPIYIPTVKIVTDNENFIINASDTRNITKVSINFNNNISEVDVNNTEYSNNLKLQNGENRLILVVYNSDGLSITKKIRYVKQ